MYKKILYGLAAMALLNSCNEDFTNWAQPQSNDPIESENVKLDVSPASSNVIDLATVTDDSVQIITIAKSMPEAYKLDSISACINKPDNSGTISLPISFSGKVAKADIETIIESLYGYEPAERTVNGSARIYAWSSAARKTYVCSSATPFSIKIKADRPVIESAYYVYGNVNNWSTTSDDKYLAKYEGDDQYANSVFTVTIPAVSDTQYNTFKLAPASAYTRQTFTEGEFVGVATDDACEMSGKIVVSKDAKPFKIDQIVNEGVNYVLTVNFRDSTYSINVLNYPSAVYYAGDANGWSATSSPMFGSDGVFTGYYYVTIPSWGALKFVADGKWCGGTDGTIVENGGDNISPDEVGFYKITADWNSMTYSFAKIDRMSLIGSAVNGDSSWGTDYDLTFNTETQAWEGEYTMTDGDYKIRANHDWALSWGGSENAMTSSNGANLSITAGKYKFSFKPNCDGQGTLTVTPAN